MMADVLSQAGLKVVLIEAGFAWLPALGYRLDAHWKKLRAEVPHLRKKPSEYIREHVYVTTQPMEETEKPEHLLQVMEMTAGEQPVKPTRADHPIELLARAYGLEEPS